MPPAQKEGNNSSNPFLEHMPQRFPFFEEAYIPPNKYHKMFIEKWYLVLYQIQDDTVYVEYIVDCRKDYNWLIH